MPRSRKKSLRARYQKLTFWNKVSFWSGIASVLGLIAALYALYAGQVTTRQLTRVESQVTHEGILLPEHAPDPPSICGPMPMGSVKLYLGDVVFVVVGDSPTVALAIDDKQVVTLRRSDRGVNISAKAWSSDGRLIAEIRDNSFSVNPNNSFRLTRAGESDLTVYDQQGAVALRALIINEHAVRLSGIFQPGASKVVITENTFEIDGQRRLSNVCAQVPASPNLTLVNVG